MWKYVKVLIYLVTLLKTEKFEYDVLFEKAINQNLNNPTDFLIPDLITNWNISFWFKINNTGSLDESNVVIFQVLNNLGTRGRLEIKPESGNRIYFTGHNFFSNLLLDSSVNDLKNLSATSQAWVFFSLNYIFKEFQLLHENYFSVITTTEEFLFAQDALLCFNNPRISSDGIKVTFAHVHFFRSAILHYDNDFREISFYPNKVLALYKFSSLHTNTSIILNLVDYQKYRSLKITNNHKVPFKNYNSYIDVKIDFPFMNRSIVFKNLIICIKGNMIFKNFIDSDNNYVNQFWYVNWYTRISEDGLNSLTLQTRVSYSDITALNHDIKFSTVQSENNLNPDFSTGISYQESIGDESRDNYKLDFLAIVQIRDIPQPDGGARSKVFFAKIPTILYEHTFNYNFDLSYYDTHYFKITFDDSNKILFYFVLNEILFYEGEKIDSYGVEEIYLGQEKKILIFCSALYDAAIGHNFNDDLLRVTPDNNEIIILDQCTGNENVCPSIPGCAFCISGICQYCKINFEKIGNTCMECTTTEILFENTCQTSNFLDINDIENTFASIIGKVVALKITLESLSNILNPTSPKNKFSSTIYYPINDISNEMPHHMIALLDLSIYTFHIEYIILDEIGNGRSFNNSYGCKDLENLI